MILLQLSAGQGPSECCLAVSKATKILTKEAQDLGVTLCIAEQITGQAKNTLKSVLYRLEGDAALILAERWNGSMLWICQSPFRPKHKRKNWFFTGSFTEHTAVNLSDEIKFEACRSSGPGGQHANKTSSAVRATHLDTGFSVKVQSERSQHLNKRLAKALIELKLAEAKSETEQKDKGKRHKSHHSIERGNAVRVFKGERFVDEMV